MTAVKVVIIKCDGCGATTPSESLIINDLLHLEGGAPAHVVEARHAAVAKGWVHTAHGKDLCPACRTTPVIPGKARLLSHIPHPHWGHSR